MLDQETKRKIDSCRDILVGKLPDPKSQVEQITIALIYKFMDDMDKASEEMGGNPTFFTGEFKKYAWSNIFDARLGGHEVTALYGEAIDKMNQNPNIPQLFRNIFKNAYLPYRDPETLKSFLKEINAFTYEHSERLGDAFEYLLSVLGSQGDAGQFRTPRHIIDFIVEIVQPTKNDIVLDPSCGTAGFLISAYKHILKCNKKDGKSQLTPDERTRLMHNFFGYDISPDMVRLSLANMYLHGFSDPKIFEYDTLTSEDRWNDTADVILANPPFMTPKGGIRPHKRFSFQANRSEVLFVDYIAEHLNPGGRAGVIVPEGIIFQASNAYKQLRKMLVENYLWAVISLPAGIFQPYSGVKTSILIMDKAIAKKTDKILFVKIDNDGFGLGAQRRSIEKNDLPKALKYIRDYQDSLNNGKEIEPSQILYLVEKSKIIESGDWNLSGERYRDSFQIISTAFEMVDLSDMCEIESGSRQKGGALLQGIPSIGGGEIDNNGKIKLENMKYVSSEHFINMKKGKLHYNDVLVVKDGATTGKTGIYKGEFEQAAVNEHVYIFRSKDNTKPIYLYHLIRGDIFQNKLKKYIKGIIGGISSEIRFIQIPLPPLSVQQEIAAEIDSYQKIIDGAHQVVDNYKPTIKIDPDWEMVALGKHCKIKGGNAFKSSDYVDDGVQLIRMGNIKRMFFDANNSQAILPIEYIESYSNYILEKGDLLISMTGTVGKEDYGNVCQIDIEEKYLLNQRVGKFEIFSNELLIDYLYYIANSENFRKQLFANSSGGVRQSNISNKGIEKIIIPIPPIEMQQKIVTKIESEQEMVNANKKLIDIYEQNIKDKILEVWGE